MCYKSLFLGNFRNILKAGTSRPWPEVLEEATGTQLLDATAIVDYFKPLSDWLDDYIEENNVPVGWWPGKNQHEKTWKKTEVTRKRAGKNEKQLKENPILAYISNGRYAKISKTYHFPFPKDFKRWAIQNNIRPIR